MIPGKIGSRYIEMLRRNQIEFLRSITASEETAIKARKAWPMDDPSQTCPSQIKKNEDR